MDMDDLRKMMRGDIPQEDLEKELEAAKKLVNGKWQLQHPLVTEDEYDPFYNFDYNNSLHDKKEKKAKATEAKDWNAFLHLHEKVFWPAAIGEIQALVPHDEWGAIVRTAWIDSDHFWNSDAPWRRIAQDVKGSAGLMTDDERTQLAAMPEELTLYRGCKKRNAEGLSWTISYDWADYFAYKAIAGDVISGKAKKSDVIAYFDRNKEEKEIVILPENVKCREKVN